MRIKMSVRIPDQTVPIDIDADDVIAAIYAKTEDFTPAENVIRVVNALAAVFRKLPDSAIAELSSGARKTVRKFLLEQADRFGC